MALLHVHHHGQRNTTCSPLSSRSGQVANGRKISCYTAGNQHKGCVTKGIAIVSVKVGGECTASLIAKEVGVGAELTGIGSFLLHGSQTLFYHGSQQLFCFDAGNLYVSVGVTVCQELSSNGFRQGSKGFVGSRSQVGLEPILAGSKISQSVELVLMSSHGVVQFGNQALHFGNEFHQSFGNQNDSKVFLVLCTLGDNTANIIGNSTQGHLLCLNFLRNQANIRLCLQGAFQSNVAGRASHQLDKVPVLLGTVGITANISNQLGISLTSSVKSKACFNLLVLQVTVDSLGNTDNTGLLSQLQETLCQQGCICVGVITTDDYNGIQVKLFCSGNAGCILLGSFNLGASRTNHVESTSVAVFIHKGISNFYIFTIDKSRGTTCKTDNNRILISLLDSVIQTGNNIVSTGSLSTRKNDSNTDFLQGIRIVTLLEQGLWLSVSILEQVFQLSLVSNGTGGLSKIDYNILRLVVRKNSGQLWLVPITGLLQCRYSLHGFSSNLRLPIKRHIPDAFQKESFHRS